MRRKQLSPNFGSLCWLQDHGACNTGAITEIFNGTQRSFNLSVWFPKKPSMETAVVYLVDHILEHTDKQKLTVAAFIDLKKAFDLDNYKCPLHKLEHYGVKNKVLNGLKTLVYKDCAFLSGKCLAKHDMIKVWHYQHQFPTVDRALLLRCISDYYDKKTTFSLVSVKLTLNGKLTEICYTHTHTHTRTHTHTHPQVLN